MPSLSELLEIDPTLMSPKINNDHFTALPPAEFKQAMDILRQSDIPEHLIDFIGRTHRVHQHLEESAGP